MLIEVPGQILLGNGWRFTFSIQSKGGIAEGELYGNPDRFTAYLDCASFDAPLSLRVRLDGDRFQPLGMAAGSVKLSDYLINEKIPVRARDHWPLICCGERIAWVAGMRIDHQYRITKGTEEVLKIHLYKQEQ
jgi:tRNA(Ile)-lysidine synthase